MSIKISFIAPCFNEQDWLSRLLLSLNVCQMDFEAIEFVVADNGSTDRTVEVLWDLLPSLKFKVRLVHEFKKGVSFARNAGAQVAKGEVFVFVDADNLLTQDFIDQLWETYSLPGFCGATVRTLAEPGSIKGSAVFYILEVIKMVLPRPFGKSIAKREAFFDVGGFERDIALGENVVFTSSLKKLAKKNRMQFFHITAPIYCSLRRFEKVGYSKILMPWLIAYLGARHLPYDTVDKL